jgi:hypothetical protein
MTSGRKTPHFFSSFLSIAVAPFSRWRLRATAVDLARKLVAALLVYATVAGSMPVQADSRSTPRTGSSVVVSPSSFLGKQYKGIGAIDEQVLAEAGQSESANPAAHPRDLTTVPPRLLGNAAFLRSAIETPHLLLSTINSSAIRSTLSNLTWPDIAGVSQPDPLTFIVPPPVLGSSSDAVVPEQPTRSSEPTQLLASASQTSKSPNRNANKAKPLSQGAAASCLYALDATAQGAFSLSGSTSISTSCSAVVESNASQAFQMSGTETLYLQNSAQVGVVGGWSLSGQTKIVNQSTGQTVQPVKISSPGDPLAFLPIPTGGTIIGKSHTSYDMNNKPPNNTLSPGIYCGGLTVGNTNGATFTMSPGTYIMAGGGLTLNSLAVVNGSGVTVYNTSSTGWGCSGSSSYTPITISGQANVTLSAPTTGALADVLLFGDRAGCSQVGSCQDQINGGSSTTFNGAMYFKSDTLLFSGSTATGCMMAVADKLNFNGNSSFSISGCTGTFGGVSVSVTPTAATLYAAQTQQFSATVLNTSNTAVTWSISPSSSGLISPSGLYTAPSSITSQQSVTVTATSQAEPTVSASAIITLMPPLAVTVAPTTATLYGGQTQQFSANVINTSNTGVIWSISPTGTGTINSSGLYTAPATISTQQTVIVTATSQASSTASASATVTLMPKTSQTISGQLAGDLSRLANHVVGDGRFRATSYI